MRSNQVLAQTNPPGVPPQHAAAPSPEQALAQAAAARGLTNAALLFLAGHEPLTLAAGHGLALAAPVAALLGVDAIQQWAVLLTTPGAAARLKQALAAAEWASTAEPASTAEARP